MYWLSRLMLRLAVATCAHCVLLAAVLLSPWSWVVLAFLVVNAVRNRRKRLALTAHGTAWWATEDQLRQAGMIDATRGLFLGWLCGPAQVGLTAAYRALRDRKLGAKDACRRFFAALRRRRERSLVRLPQAINTALFAPVGAGKSTALVIPFLLACDESAVIIDFKGELSLATAEARRRLGHEIVILDPYGVVTPKLRFKSATFNALDFIDKQSPLALDDCNGTAQALVVRTGEEKDGAHWLDGAEEFISAVAGVVVQYGTPGQRSLQEVADILGSPPKLELAIKLMLESPAWDGMLARSGGKLLHFVDKEKSSVLTTCGRFLRFLNTPAMAAATRASSFVHQMKRRKQTVFITLPPERIKPAAGWLRLMVGSLIRAVVREGLGEGRKVHYVLDEAASLGMLDAVEDLVDKYRGYGCRAQFYYQSTGQLAKCWPKDQDTTLLSNTSQIYFSVRDLQTANLVSSMLGKETIIVESGGTGASGGSNTGWSEGAGNSSRSGGSNSGWSTNEGWQQAPRELLKPEEVLALPPQLAITFPGGGLPPVATTLVRHFEEPGLFRRSGWLSRLRMACRTLVGSVVLLAVSVGMAALLPLEVADRQRQPYQPPPYQQQQPLPPLEPGPARPAAPVPFPIPPGR